MGWLWSAGVVVLFSSRSWSMVLCTFCVFDALLSWRLPFAAKGPFPSCSGLFEAAGTICVNVIVLHLLSGIDLIKQCVAYAGPSGCLHVRFSPWPGTCDAMIDRCRETGLE